MQPLTLCAYEVDAEPVFHSRDEAERTAFGVTESELRCETWESEMLEGRVPPSQVLADRLIAAGQVGMLVPSFARGASVDDFNLVLWRWGPEPPARIVLIDDEGRLS